MNTLVNCLSSWNIDIDDKALELFDRYYELLIFYNEKINLTSITLREDVDIKHFADSIAILRYIDPSEKYIGDIGTGAGFPGIPIKIMCPDCKMVLMDSLGKRVKFLEEVIKELGLTYTDAVHGRAEDLAKDQQYREKFDIVTSRAVSNLRTLSEYCLPFVSVGGMFVSYKSGTIDDEISESGNAISTLGGKINRIERFTLPSTDYERSLVMIDKAENTAERFPRKAGTPLKKPL